MDNGYIFPNFVSISTDIGYIVDTSMIYSDILNLAFSDDYSKFEYLYLIHRKCVVLDEFIEFKTY